jgi:hypothetical protein
LRKNGRAEIECYIIRGKNTFIHVRFDKLFGSALKA